MADKAVAQALLDNMDAAIRGLIKVMPGITCPIVTEQLKIINDSLATLRTEAENHDN